MLFPSKCYWSHQIEEDEMVRECGARGGKIEMWKVVLVGKFVRK